ncbi:crocetin glucosyltransferase, chloroplastic-like [Amaranthus tricolor]|uniref:crocetin glucosyltransferase, chloroplastic-like n=1 Tax=Amaranthus tricolor TaxID=29722 RepID=UPI002590D9BF|nr:crocetin glucosyltransferase, chloroplastic-like [Amaranthus tricolor]
MAEQKPHFLLMTYPAQGHINPALQFSKKLRRAGADVTLITSVSAHTRIDKATVPTGVEFESFSDGYDNGYRASDGDVMDYLSTFRQRGANTLETLFQKSASKGKHVTCVVYTLLLPWAAEVARKFHVPSALLWIQPATVFDVYYYYFNGYGDIIKECEKDPSWSLELPNLPFKLVTRDLPSFLLPSNPFLYTFALPTFQEQMEQLEKEEKPRILVNSFEDLEIHAFKSIEKLSLVPIGPLLPSAFLDGKDPSDKSFGGDLFQKSKDTDYIKWLNLNKCSSVIYVSFGSLSVLSKEQMEQLAIALIQTHRPFLWVIREIGKKEKFVPDNNEEDSLSCMEQLKQQGLIVPWCSQVEVLSHPSVGCFVTHCGWNSTLESLTSGVPMVAFPQWTDQTTNAKLVEDIWKSGVRVKVSNEEGGLVKSEEIKRCLEIVMESEEIRENAKKWKELAVEAAQEGGSSDRNLKAFMEELFNVDCQNP